ncbi:hypothetical protein JKP88DRAFT_327398 [Tribonema minus]|uniref:Uncharacterized protein n=1 Tax=Tribonema minus TaxID=303371 RepID=A0A835YZ11_9STRA|nr:hypothetical protein JKP88DRAFT_327398 [Tribonema minus]
MNACDLMTEAKAAKRLTRVIQLMCANLCDAEVIKLGGKDLQLHLTEGGYRECQRKLEACISAGLHAVLVAAVYAHMKCKAVLSVCLTTVSDLAVFDEELLADELYDAGIIEAVIAAVKAHPADPSILESALYIVRWVVVVYGSYDPIPERVRDSAAAGACEFVVSALNFYCKTDYDKSVVCIGLLIDMTEHDVCRCRLICACDLVVMLLRDDVAGSPDLTSILTLVCLLSEGSDVNAAALVKAGACEVLTDMLDDERISTEDCEKVELALKRLRKQLMVQHVALKRKLDAMAAQAR